MIFIIGLTDTTILPGNKHGLRINANIAIIAAVPIIIDTPLARISREPSKNIAHNLPNYLEDKQVTLLVTEKEFSEEVKNELIDNIGKEYVIRIEEQRLGNLASLEVYIDD